MNRNACHWSCVWCTILLGGWLRKNTHLFNPVLISLLAVGAFLIAFSFVCVAEGKTGADECGGGNADAGFIGGGIFAGIGILCWFFMTKCGRKGCCCCCSGHLLPRLCQRESHLKTRVSEFKQARAAHTTQVEALQHQVANATRSPLFTFVVQCLDSGEKINVTTNGSVIAASVAKELNAEQMMLGSSILLLDRTLESQAVMDGTLITVPSLQMQARELRIYTELEMQLTALKASVPQESQFQGTEKAWVCAPGCRYEPIDWDDEKCCYHQEMFCDFIEWIRCEGSCDDNCADDINVAGNKGVEVHTNHTCSV